MNESSCCSPFGVISVLCFGSSNGSIVISYCCFSLHFPDDIWCGASYLPSVSSLVWYLLKSLAHFLIGLLLIFKLQEFFFSDNSPLSGVPFAKIFPIWWLLFSFSQKHTFLIWMKASIPIISFLDCAFGIVAKPTQAHLDFLLHYLLGVLRFCVLHLGLWFILSSFLWRM